MSISVPACLGDPVSVSGGWRVCGPEQRSRSLVFVKWPCMAPSIRSPENNSLSASVCILTHRCVRGHMEPPPVSDCRPTGAEPDLAGTRPTCSPEWTENTEGTTGPQEEVPMDQKLSGCAGDLACSLEFCPQPQGWVALLLSTPESALGNKAAGVHRPVKEGR